MQMYSFFWCGFVIDDFLFKGFNISTVEGMVGICFGSMLLAFSLVGVTFTKEILLHSQSAQQQGQAVLTSSQILQVWTSPWKVHTLQTAMTLIQITMGYFVMLIVMSFNVYLMLAVLLGSVLAYFWLNPYLAMKRMVTHRPRRRLMNEADCQEECGALIEGPQEHQQGCGPSNSSDESTAKEFSIAATVHCAD